MPRNKKSLAEAVSAEYELGLAHIETQEDSKFDH